MISPRSTSERIGDTLDRLEDDLDAWVSSSSAERPWLAPLSFLWHEGQILLATNSATPTVRNVLAVPVVRVALGHTRDVVMIQGQASIIGPVDLQPAQVEHYQHKHGSDPRTWADAFVLVRPIRILAWREENEQAGRLVMKDGTWLE